MCKDTGSQHWDPVSLYGQTISKFPLVPGYERFSFLTEFSYQIQFLKGH